jgi:predicted DNA-binding WGR domain protein
MRRFELIEGTASKFWEIEQADAELNIRWGRIGTAGQSQTKSFADAGKAAFALTKLAAEKSGKGYSEVGVAAGAAIGATPAKPKEAAAEKAPAPATAKPTAATATEDAAASAAAPTEGIDSQADRVFEAVRAQIEAGTLTASDTLSAGTLKRQHGVSEQGAALAFKRLKAAGLLYGWGASCTPAKDAQATAKALGMAPATSAQAPAAPASAADLPADADTPPWLAAGTPVRLSPDMLREAFPSRRFPPKPIEAPVSVGAAWLPVRRKLDLNIDLSGTDAGLRDAAQRMLDRSTQPIPAADAEADAVLLALALSSGNHGNSEMGAQLVPYLAAQYGLPGAVDILLAAQQVEVQSAYDRATKKHQYTFGASVSRPMGSAYYGPLGEGEQAFRTHLALTTPDVWQDCRDRIVAGLPKVHESRQPALAMLLPDAPDISDALVHSLAAAKDTPETMHWLQLTATDPEAVALAAKVRLSYSSGFWGSGAMTSTLVQERGVAAVPVLERGAATDDAGDALACIGTPEAVQALARVASTSKGALARLALAVDRWPMAAIPALARLVAAGGKDANLVKPSLTRLLRAHGAALPALRPWLDAGAQGVIDQQLALLAGPTEVAEPGELPGVLVAPPWLAKVQKKAAGALALEPLTLVPVEQWGEGERESALRMNSWQTGRHDAARKNIDVLLDELGFDKDKKKNLAPFGKTAADAIAVGDADALVASWRAMLAERKKERYYWFTFRASFASLLPAAVGVPFWNAVAGEAESDDIGLMLATHGLAVLPGLVAMVRSKPTENLAYAQNYGAAELAMPAARAFAKLKTLRAEGRAWLLKYPEHAACGLIAPALGKAGEARDCAGSALRLLLANGHEALLLDVAGRYGKPEVVEALHAMLDERALDRLPEQARGPARILAARRLAAPAPEERQGAARCCARRAGNDDGLPDQRGSVCRPAPGQGRLHGREPGRFRVGLLLELAQGRGSSQGRLGAHEPGPVRQRRHRPQTHPVHPRLARRGGARARRRRSRRAGRDRQRRGADALERDRPEGQVQGLAGQGPREDPDAVAEARGLSPEELEDRLAPDLGLDEQGSMRARLRPARLQGRLRRIAQALCAREWRGRQGRRAPARPAQAEENRRRRAGRAGQRALQAAQERCAHHRQPAGAAPRTGDVRAAPLEPRGVCPIPRRPSPGAPPGAPPGVGRVCDAARSGRRR